MQHKQLALALALGLSSPMAHAMDLKTFDAIQEKRHRLEAEEQSINRLYQNNEQLSQRLGLIRHIQNNILRGQDGVLERSSRWFAQADTWLGQWQKLIQSAQSIKSSDVEGLSDQFDAGFKALDDAFSKLVSDSIEIREVMSQVRSELEQKDPLPIGLQASNKQYIEALNLQQSKMIAFLKEVDSAFVENSNARFDIQIAKIREYITLQLRNMRLNFPELREAIDRVEQKIAYVAEFQSVYGNFRRQAMRTEGQIADLKLFQAEESLKSLLSERDRIKLILEQKGIQGKLLNDSKRLIDQVYTRSSDALKNADAELPRSLSFYSFVDMERTLLSEDCRDPKVRPLRDCELLAVLNRVSFDSEKMEQWKNADMSYFEKQISKVRKGPGFGQETQ